MSSPQHMILVDHPCTPNPSPQFLMNILIKNESNKVKLLKQLQQLHIPTEELRNVPLNQLYQRFQGLLKNSYSVKYLGLNENEIGMISRRIDPLRDSGFCLGEITQSNFTVNKYFYPKPLNVPKKNISNIKINVYNLQDTIKKDFEKRRVRTSHTKRNIRKNQPSVRGSWISLHRAQTSMKMRPGKTQGTSQKEKQLTIMSNQKIRQTIGLTVKQDQSQTDARSYSRKLSRGILKLR